MSAAAGAMVGSRMDVRAGALGTWAAPAGTADIAFAYCNDFAINQNQLHTNCISSSETNDS